MRSDMTKKKAKKAKAKKPKTGEVDVAALMQRVERECTAGQLTTATALDLAAAIQERLPFDLGECTGEFVDEVQDQVAHELSDLCCAVAAVSGDRARLGVQ